MEPKQPLNILLSSTYFYPYLSGLTDYPLALAKHFAKTSNITVLTFQHQRNLAKKTKYKNINIYRLPVHIRIFKGLWNFFYPFLALKEVIKADIILINLPQFEGFILAVWAKLWHKKVYAIYHCELDFNKNIFYKAVARMANFSAQITCVLADKIIVYTKDYALNSSVLKKFLAKTTAVLPPVTLALPDKGYFDKLQKISKDRSPIIGFSGRIAREKGLEYLFRAVKILQKTYPGLVLLCAGPYGRQVAGEENYYQKIKKIMDRDKISAIFLGKLSKSELASFYQVIDLLVLPSVNKTEAFGMVQIEAILSGKPVVASDLPGVRIPVVMTGMGETAKISNGQDLAQKIKTVWQNKDRYIKNKRIIQKMFAVQKTWCFYEELFNEK